MNDDFWRERWAKGSIGFHENAPNAFLRAHVSRLQGDSRSAPGRVLVPLCGKSTDLGFLRSQGFDVAGVELVRSAAEDFFREHELTAKAGTWHGLESLHAEGVRIAIGNFFNLTLPDSERFGASYDRAALIAMSPEDRERYVATLLAALCPGARILLVTFFYEGGTFTGPPFSVGEADVRRLFSACQIECLGENDLTDREPRYRERGSTLVLEQAWLVTLGR